MILGLPVAVEIIVCEVHCYFDGHHCEPHLCLLKIWPETESRVKYFSPVYRHQRSGGSF